MTHQLLAHGLLLLFVIIAIESAGVPLPGETALIAAAILASQHHYGIVSVIAVAAVAAIVGDNVGYWIGRQGGRALLERWGPAARYADRVLPPAERFFARHGAKAVFIGRFIAVLRVTAAWLAGISRMPWWRFLFWNAAGGVLWATLVGVVAYQFGRSAADAIGRYGLYGAIVVVVIGIVGGAGFVLIRRRLEREPRSGP